MNKRTFKICLNTIKTFTKHFNISLNPHAESEPKICVVFGTLVSLAVAMAMAMAKEMGIADTHANMHVENIISLIAKKDGNNGRIVRIYDWNGTRIKWNKKSFCLSRHEQTDT